VILSVPRFQHRPRVFSKGRAGAVTVGKVSLMQDPDVQLIREIVLGKLQGDPERYLAEYTARFGNVLNADDAATLFDEYNADRARYRVAVHPAATWIRDELFRRALAEFAPQGKDSVVFTAGSNAAGKSTAIALTEVHRKAHSIFDSTFSNPDHACVLIEQTLAAEKRIIILYIHRPLNDAMMVCWNVPGARGVWFTSISLSIHIAVRPKRSACCGNGTGKTHASPFVS